MREHHIMKTITPRQVGSFIESLIGDSADGDILIVRNGETLARLEKDSIDRLAVKQQFEELRRRRAGVRVDRETLKAWREEGRR
jgi:hypothetical protein